MTPFRLWLCRRFGHRPPRPRSIFTTGLLDLWTVHRVCRRCHVQLAPRLNIPATPREIEAARWLREWVNQEAPA